ncbi:host-nuclease inhibitor Gam family protein [Desulfosarcina sp. OttesenSCG-928-G10]|nr:host-nuclease inhibitor Gam family protein [Desulfosarcina sp. OttesenSCG-928-G10]
MSEDVNKEAMLADPEAARQVPGVTIVQTEDFVVTPHETELEEIA